MSLRRCTVGDFPTLPPEVRELASKLPFDFDDFEPELPLYFSEGSAEVKTLALEGSAGLLVVGDLTVRGLLDDRPLGFDPDEAHGIVVGGNLCADTVLLAAETYVAGNVQVQLLIAESDGNLSLRIGGNLVGHQLIALGHHVHVGGDTKADFSIGYLGLSCDIQKPQMKDAFHPDVVNQWGGIDIDEVARRALSGQPFLT